jgi:hypothetical protein
MLRSSQDRAAVVAAETSAINLVVAAAADYYSEQLW